MRNKLAIIAQNRNMRRKPFAEQVRGTELKLGKPRISAAAKDNVTCSLSADMELVGCTGDFGDGAASLLMIICGMEEVRSKYWIIHSECVRL
tara:strand:+ start:653 stop:928 length:276 start_codon:yes stop_codon:yes gene_type:complete